MLIVNTKPGWSQFVAGALGLCYCKACPQATGATGAFYLDVDQNMSKVLSKV